MADFSADNQAILQAILNTGAQILPTTLNTGTFDPNQQQQQPGPFTSQLPNATTAPLGQLPNYTNTIQRFFNPQPFGQPSNFRFPQSPINHTVGRNDLSSRMSLDNQAILNNLGLGNKQ